VGHVDVSGISYVLPDGRVLLDGVSFRVGDGAKVALVGDNGSGKTTLLRLVAGDIDPTSGSISRSGGLGVMRQFIGNVRDDTSIRDLVLSVAPPRLRAAAAALDEVELAMMENEDEPTQLRYASALAEYADAGGYDAEVLWDVCTTTALGLPYDEAKWRDVRTLSGGEQKRLVLGALLRGPDEVLLLDEPDNYLDVPGKRWLEERLRDTQKTVLYVSHDRELLAQTATRIVTIEARTAWTHGGGFASYHQVRGERIARLEELHRRWNEEHERLKELVRTLQIQAKSSEAMAQKYRAMQTRLAKFEAAGPPPDLPEQQNVRMHLRGGRTGVRAITCKQLELTGLMQPFDLEVFYGERVGVLGANGSGKSHFLRLLGGGEVKQSGAWKLGARVVPGTFLQTHAHPELFGKTLVDILWQEAHDRGRAMSILRRYELHQQADQRFETLSGGQQARFQVLLLEIQGATLLLLDEPTDNLDVASAEALEDGLAAYEGTVVAVTHDRWFARSFDRFLVFRADGSVTESTEPVWDETRPVRPAPSPGRPAPSPR
jgi:ATPase subunit of ABC transporter with duplicated ATPase domains